MSRFRPHCPPELLLARLLAGLRRRQGLSQPAFADVAGLSTPTVAALETNRSSITLPMLDDLAGALGQPGLLLHALHAQAQIDLQREGCPVPGATWRRPRGRNAPSVDRQPEGLELSPAQVDAWLDEWFEASPVAQLALDAGSECDVIVRPDIPWSPTRFEQRLGRIDRTGARDPEFRIVDLELGLRAALPAKGAEAPANDGPGTFEDA